jgi:hypothetical protein
LSKYDIISKSIMLIGKAREYGKKYVKIYVKTFIIGAFILFLLLLLTALTLGGGKPDPVAVYFYLSLMLLVLVLIYFIPAFMLYRLINTLHEALHALYVNYEVLREDVNVKKETLARYTRKLSRAKFFIHLYVLRLIILFIPLIPATLNLGSKLSISVMDTALNMAYALVTILFVIPLLYEFYSTLAEFFRSDYAAKTFLSYIILELVNIASSFLKTSFSSNPLSSLQLILMIIYLYYFWKMTDEIMLRKTPLRGLVIYQYNS